MRRLASTLLLLIATSCGGPQRLLRDPACLDGPPPHVGRDGDEQIALTQREWERATQATPFARAQMLETLRALAPDLSDRFSAPRCDDDLVRTNARATAISTRSS